MENSAITVEALKKVSLVLTAGTTTESIGPVSEPYPVDFIFGIGSRGLTGFEYELAGKRAGDKGAVTVNQHTRPEVFGHILPCEIQSRLTAGPCCIQYEILGISDPTPREIVSSIASGAGGCGDGCGCDCGGH